MHGARPIALAALAVILAGCETAPVKEFQEEIQNIFKPYGKAEENLEAGVRAYEDANYDQASRLLQASLDEGLPRRTDRARAHKYLAFIHCVSGRQGQCREQFRQALTADSNFDLSPSEAGHPMWGPVFRNVKAQSQ